MRDFHSFFATTIIALACVTSAAADSDNDPRYVRLPVHLRTGIEERKFPRTEVQQDTANFIGLCVLNDDVTAGVLKQSSKLSAENFAKYFASEEFANFSKSRLGKAARIFYPLNVSSIDDGYLKSHKFLPKSIVVFPDSSDSTIGIIYIDANGSAQLRQAGMVEVPTMTQAAMAAATKLSRMHAPMPRPLIHEALSVNATQHDAIRTVGPSANSAHSSISDVYLSDLYRRIKKAWTPPRLGQTFGRAIVHFKINKDGNLSVRDIQVERSSGNTIFDQTTVQAIQNAAPFRPLPEGLPNPFETGVAFDYNDSQ